MLGHVNPQCCQPRFLSPPQQFRSSPSVSPPRSEGFEAPSTSERGIPTSQSPQIQHKGAQGLFSHLRVSFPPCFTPIQHAEAL